MKSEISTLPGMHSSSFCSVPTEGKLKKVQQIPLCYSVNDIKESYVLGRVEMLLYSTGRIHIILSHEHESQIKVRMPQ